MKHKTNSNRRDFLKKSAVAAAAFTIVPRHVLGRGFIAPSDKIGIGVIGTGKQSYGLMRNFVKEPMAEILAAADIYKLKRENFKSETEKFIAQQGGKSNSSIDIYHEYREILERSDIDAVIIATPDHWHAMISIDAMKYGKDVYCEKPLAHTINEGRAMVNVARTEGKILQTGSMQRSWRDFRHACELVRNGYIGELTEVLVNVGDPPLTYDKAEESIPDDLDWNYWLGPAPACNYNNILAPDLKADFWPKWRDYKEFGGGILSDWGAHMFDIAQWGMGTDHTGPIEIIPPTEANAKRGCVFIYENGVKVKHEDFGRGWAVRFIGSEGSIDVSRSFLESTPENIVKETIKDSDIKLYHSENHYGDWLNCIKTRRQPVADVEIGHRSSSLCYLAAIGYELRRHLYWNPKTERFYGDPEANKKTTKEYRYPWKFDAYDLNVLPYYPMGKDWTPNWKLKKQ